MTIMQYRNSVQTTQSIYLLYAYYNVIDNISVITIIIFFLKLYFIQDKIYFKFVLLINYKLFFTIKLIK